MDSSNKKTKQDLECEQLFDFLTEEKDLEFIKAPATQAFLKANKPSNIRPKRNPLFFSKTFLAAAASICLICVFIFTQQLAKPTDPFAAAGLSVTPTEILATTSIAPERSAENDLTTKAAKALLQQAVDAYKKGDFNTAAPLFQAYLEQDEILAEARLYYGQCLIENHPQQALEQFDLIINSTELTTAFKDHAQLFKIYAFNAAGEQEAALDLAKSISSSISSLNDEALLLYELFSQEN